MDCQLHLRDDYTKPQALFFVVTVTDSMAINSLSVGQPTEKLLYFLIISGLSFHTQTEKYLPWYKIAGDTAGSCSYVCMCMHVRGLVKCDFNKQWNKH